jgi:fumarylacetoacetate (FAA) hydrolase
MKLATLKDGTRDGKLIVVSRDLSSACEARGIAGTLQRALDDWERTVPGLRGLYEKLNCGTAEGAFAFDPHRVMAPLPRAYQWADGSTYSHHAELMQSAFEGENKVESTLREVMIYQGGSDDLIGCCDDIVVADEAWGIDFEGEVTVITGDVRMQAQQSEAESSIRLVMLANDVSLRNLIMAELAKGFGFYQSKPATSFSPVAATLDELGAAWSDGLVQLPLRVEWNGMEFGRPNAGVGVSHNLFQLILHATRTRNLCAGTIIGGGTVSNADPSVGSACIAERRAHERIEHGMPKTPYMKWGDRVRIEMLDASGNSIFGAIDQKVVGFRRENRY